MLDTILKQENFSRQDLVYLMKLTDNDELEKLYNAAYNVKLKYVGNKVYYRGLIEFSNICSKDCYYCGIRAGNFSVKRFMSTKEQILEMALWAYENKYGSVTLQSGERKGDDFEQFVFDVLCEIKKQTNGKLGITLCLGEQSEDTYRKWFNAGAHRYLLRIETTNKDLYRQIHPQNERHSFDERVACLKTLKSIGYQVGTGVMSGLPNQKEEDLVDDILFFKDNDIDMIGMGPYVVHKNTPLGQKVIDADQDGISDKNKRAQLGLKMIAISRIYLKDVNIAATTALQALNPFGRELGLKAGANILMPIITLPEYRKDYQLYDDKPCIEDTASDCKNCLARRVAGVGDIIGYGEFGDSPHFLKSRR